MKIYSILFFSRTVALNRILDIIQCLLYFEWEFFLTASCPVNFVSEIDMSGFLHENEMLEIQLHTAKLKLEYEAFHVLKVILVFELMSL